MEEVCNRNQNKMRIGIVTQPLTTNYGGILQNYALQQILRIMGHEVITLDYGKITWLEYIHNMASYIKGGMKWRAPENPICRRNKESGFRQFISRNINVTRRSVRIDWRACRELDAVIVGSDQVWRPCYNYDILSMFLLPIADMSIKKIAYAASFGTSDWEFTAVQTSKCAQLIKSFDGVSVREHSGVDLCKRYLGVEASQVLDPTILMCREDYVKLCESIETRSPFVFAYILDEDEAKVTEIQRFAQKHSLPYIIKSAGPNASRHDTVEQWLSYFRDARYVITDSFHGTVFSIIFNKDFMVYGNPQRGNDRFYTLLTCARLEDRMKSSLPSEWAPIRWAEVNESLVMKRTESLTWLKNQLQG